MNLIKRNQSFIFRHLWISCNLPKQGCTHAHNLYKISNEKKRNVRSQELSHSLLSNCKQYHMLHFVHIQTEQTQPRKNMYLLFWREISTPSLFCDMNMMGVYIKYCIFFTFQHS